MEAEDPSDRFRIRSQYEWATAWALKHDVYRRVLAGFSVLILAGALWVIYHQLLGYEYAAVWTHLSGLPRPHVALAVILTGVNFGVLAGYDALSLRYVNTRLSLKRLGLSSFVGYSVSQVAGSPLLTGGSVRYRLYSSWGMEGKDIAKAILFAGASFWLGFLTLGGGILLVGSPDLPPLLRGSVSSVLLVIGCFSPLVLYVGVGLLGPRTVRVWRWGVDLPPLWMLPVQLGLAATDLLVAAAVLYVLLPPSAPISFLTVIGVYLIALLAGLVSHVPGGLGVFDSIVVTGLSPAVSPPEVLGALLAFRGIFHLLPLAGAGLAFATYKLWGRHN